jgi:tetratricopeptide (TPR) repeat protein
MRMPRVAVVLALGLAGCQTQREGVAINLTALRDVLRHREAMRPAQIEWLNQALSAEQHNDLGVLYERQGRLEDAARQYNLAAVKDCRLGKAYVNLGNVRRKQGRTEEALLRYRQAMAVDPDDFAAVNNFADLCAELNQCVEEAIGRLSAALEKEPNPYGLDTLGWLHYRAGRPEEAEEVLDSAAAAAEGNRALAATIQTHLAVVCAAMGQWPEAKDHARRARALGCTAQEAAELARVEQESGRP